MSSVGPAVSGPAWQFYVAAVGLERRGFWKAQLPEQSALSVQAHLSSFEAWTKFFDLEGVSGVDGTDSEQTATTPKSRGSSKQKAASKSRGTPAAADDNNAASAEGDQSGGAATAVGSEADGSADGSQIPPPTELSDFIESDQTLVDERVKLLGNEGLLALRVRVLLSDVLMHNALPLAEPSVVLGKRKMMEKVGEYKGSATAGGGATGIVYNESCSVSDAADDPEPQPAASAPVTATIDMEDVKDIDFSSVDALAKSSDPLLRVGVRPYYRLEDMFYTLEYDAEDWAFEQERNKGIARGVLPDVPLPNLAEEKEAVTELELAAPGEVDDGSADPPVKTEPGLDAPSAPHTPASETSAAAHTAAAPAPAVQAPPPVVQVAPAPEAPATPTQAPVPSSGDTVSSMLMADSLTSTSATATAKPPPMPLAIGNTAGTTGLPRPEMLNEDRDVSVTGSPGSAGDDTPGSGGTRELRNLLSDVKPHKPWSGSPVEGQEELCAALEEVMVALKGYTKHSYPFLTRVKKTDAPDYYDVIEHPMDLGKMHKKLKRLDYSSKQEFIDDFNLMLDNCRKYNQDPKSIYRTHAKMLDKKAKTLLRKVRDINVTSASGTPIDDMMAKPKRGRPPRQAPGSAPAVRRGRPGRPRKHSMDASMDSSVSPSPSPMPPVKRGRPGRPRKHPLPVDDSPRGESPGGAKRKRGRPGRPRKIRLEDYVQEPEYELTQRLQPTEADNERAEALANDYLNKLDPATRLQYQNEDPQIRLWRVRTLATRLRAMRERDICQALPFGEHRLLERTPKDMFQFVCNYASHCDELAVAEGSGHVNDEVLGGAGVYEGTEEALFMEKRPTFSTSNLPQVIDITIDSTKKKRGRGRISNVERQKIQEEEEIKRAMAMRAPLNEETSENYFMPEALPQCAVPDMPQPLDPVSPTASSFPFPGSVQSTMTENVEALRRIRALQARATPGQDGDGDIQMSSAGASSSVPTATAGAAASQEKAPEEVVFGAVTEDFRERSRLAQKAPDANLVMMTKAVATMLAHSGFDNAERTALEVTADACIAFMRKFAAIIQAHQITYCHKTNAEELISRSLYEMGIDGVGGLRAHMTDGVDVFRQKLQAVELLAQNRQSAPPAVVAAAKEAREVSGQKTAARAAVVPGEELGMSPPSLSVEPTMPSVRVRPSRPPRLSVVTKESANSETEVSIVEEDEDMAEAEDEAGDEGDDGDEEEEGEEEEEEDDGDEEEGDDAEGDEDEEEEDDNESVEEKKEPRKRSSRSSTLGKRSKPEPRSTRATRSRQEPPAKKAKTSRTSLSTPTKLRRRARRPGTPA